MTKENDITERAAHWLIRIESNASPELRQEFQQWLDSDVRHHAAFIRVRQGWIQCDQLKRLRPPDGTVDPDLLLNLEPWVPAPGRADSRETGYLGRRRLSASAATARQGVIRRRSLWLATAAAAASLCLFGWRLIPHQSGVDYATAIGGREQVALADGSSVDLNTDSRIRVRLSDSRRDVELVRGEALFTVTHDLKRPFYVSAGRSLIRAVGTAFSVRIRDDEQVEVVLSDGKIAVGTPAIGFTLREPTLPASAAAVTAPARALVGRQTVTVEQLAPASITRKLAWTNGRIAFDGELLGQAVREFNRYNTRHLEIADPGIRGVQIGGMFEATDPDSFVAALEKSFGIHRLPSTGEHRSGEVIRLVGRDGRTPGGP